MKIKKIINQLTKTLKLNRYFKYTMIPLFVFSVSLFIYYMVFTFKNRGPIDFSIAMVISVGGILLLSYILGHVFDLIKLLPTSMLFYVVSSIAMLSIIFTSSRTPRGNIVAVISIAVFLFALGNMIYGTFYRKHVHFLLKIGRHLLLVVSIIALVILFVWPGKDMTLNENAFNTYKTELVISETDAQYDVLTGVYGSEVYQEEYDTLEGEKSKTTSVSYFLNKWNKTRENFLGFNVYDVPLNAHYYVPDAEGTFPLVVLVHGNHEMSHSSEIGYGYLGNYLASRGYNVVSVDENFLNYSKYDSKLMGSSLGNENDARAFVLLKHVEMLLDKSSDKTSVFYNKVDEENVALIGHSRGGEAVSIASFFNQIKYLPNDYRKTFNEEFKIKSVIAIAPTDRQYKPAGKAVELKDVNYLLLHGAQDMDVTYMAGANQYDRIEFSDGSDYFKSAVYIYGANHGYFNQVWHKGDTAPLSGVLHNTSQLIERETQEQIASQLVFNFLEATLGNNDIYKKGFENLKAFESLPENLYMSQYHESNDLEIVNYTEDNYLETGTLEGSRLSASGLSKWSEGGSRLDGKYTNVFGAYLGWNRISESRYDITFDSLELDNDDVLYLTVADDTKGNEKLLDFKIRLTDTMGNESDLSISSYGMLQHQIEINLPKLYMIEDINNRESVFQTFQLPLQSFIDKSPNLDVTHLESISLIFENGDNNVIFLKDLGIRQVD